MQSARAGSTSGTTMVVGSLSDTDTLNPFVGVSVTATQVFRLTYDYLIEYDTRTNEPGPGLAKSWDVSDDGLTWTFHLREGGQWSDGKPLTSKDVEFTYQTLMDHPTLAGSNVVRNFASVTAPDPATVVFRTKEPIPSMLTTDIPIVPAHVWSGHDPAEALTADQAQVSSGPFHLVESRQSGYFKFEASDRTWRGRPKIDTLILRYFSNDDAAVQALRKGEVDVLGGLTPAQYEAVSSDPQITRNDGRSSRFAELGFNSGAAKADGTAIGNGHPALKDVRVRQAIDRAIDRSVLVDRVLDGHGDVGVGYLPTAFTPWGWKPAAGTLRTFDPAAANRMLDDAGYQRGEDGVRRMPGGGKRLAFDLLVPQTRAHYQQSATYLTSWLAAIGIEVDLLPMSDSDKSARVSAGRYDMFLGGWIIDADPDFLLSVQTCDSRPVGDDVGTTDTFACNKDYDALYQRQSVQMDRAQRTQTVQQMQQMLYTDANLLTLYYPATLEAYRSDRFTPLARRPADTGSVAGPWAYISAVPRTTTPADDGPPWPLLTGTAGLLLVLGAGLWWARATRDRRE